MTRAGTNVKSRSNRAADKDADEPPAQSHGNGHANGSGSPPSGAVVSRSMRSVASPARVANAASQIVERAASMLEQELARGIGVAKKTEEKFVDVSALRDLDPAHLALRLRKDAHELVDLLIDLVHHTLRSVGRVVSLETSETTTKSGGKLTDGSRPPGAASPGAPGFSTIRMPTPVRAGGTVEVMLSLTNSDPTPTPPFSFRTLGLVSRDGVAIPATAVVITPTSIVIPPGGAVQTKVEVRVPEDTAPGMYTGILQSTHLDALRAALTVEVQ